MDEGLDDEVGKVKISEKGLELQSKFRKIQYASLILYLLAAITFVFFHNPFLAALLVAANIFMEVKFCRCPHCNKMLDCRKKSDDERCCPHCDKFLFKGL